MSFGRLKDDDAQSAGQSVASVLRPTTASSADAVIGRGSKIVGAMSFTGPAEIDGEVEGEIHAKERLTIGESAQIKAKVVGGDIIVRGTVTGDIFASKTLVLKKPARITGNIQSAVLSIEEGVIFEGKCSMNNRDQSKQSISEKTAAA